MSAAPVQIVGASSIAASPPEAAVSSFLRLKRAQPGARRMRSAALAFRFRDPVTEDDKNEIVDTYQFETDASDAEIDQVAESFVARARSHAHAMGRSHRYTVVAYSAAEEPVGTENLFIVVPLRRESGDVEPANAQGALALLMRHAESGVQTGIAATHATLEVLLTIVRDQRSTIQAYEGRLGEVWKLVDELAGRKHERELALRQHDRQHRREDRLWSLAEKLVPLALAKLGGGAPSADGKPSEESKLVRLLKSITREQIGALTDILDAEQRQLFMDVVIELEPQMRKAA